MDLLENENHLLRNDDFIPDFEMDMYHNRFPPLDEEEKNDEISISEDSNLNNFIRREMSQRYFFQNNEEDDLDNSRLYEIPSRRAISNYLPFTLLPRIDIINPIDNINNNNSQLEPHNFNNLFSTQKKKKKKIFNIIKVPKKKN